MTPSKGRDSRLEELENDTSSVLQCRQTAKNSASPVFITRVRVGVQAVETTGLLQSLSAAMIGSRVRRVRAYF